MTNTLIAEEKVDIALLENELDKILDIAIAEDGDLVATGGFDTALLNDGQGEAQADKSEQPDALKRGGWIGNETPETVGYVVGSKLYFYYSARNTLKEKNGSVDALKASFEKYVPKYLKSVSVTGELTTNGIRISTTLYRYNGKTDKLYFNLWELTGR